MIQEVPFVSFTAQNTLIAKECREVFDRFFESQYYVLGQMTRQFEADYAQFNQTRHAIGVSNGLDAIHLALKVLQIGPGDEVIVPSNTYIATALAVEMAGARVVFAEPNARTYNIDPSTIANAIGPKTKAIIPVHLYGQACEMDAIMELAQKENLFVIEDNAQGHAATWSEKITGSFGHVNATSFYPTKNVGAFGEAGAITTHNDDLAEACKIWRNYGSEKRYHNLVKGYNNRIDELQAGLLSVKLKYIHQWTAERQKIAGLYHQFLAGEEEIILPYCDPRATHVYHLFVIQAKNRDKLQAHLEKNGIKTVIHYPIPPHLQQAYAGSGGKRGDFPLAESLAENCLSLPIYPGLSEGAIGYVSEMIRNFYH